VQIAQLWSRNVHPKPFKCQLGCDLVLRLQADQEIYALHISRPLLRVVHGRRTAICSTADYLNAGGWRGHYLGGVISSRRVLDAWSAALGSRTTAIATAADSKMTGTAVTQGGKIIARATVARHLTKVVRILVM